MTARRAFLDALAAADLPAYLSLLDPPLGGWPGRRDSPRALVPHLRSGRTGVALLEPWPVVEGRPALLAGCGVRVEFWEAGVDGELHAPPGRRALPGDGDAGPQDAVVTVGTGGRGSLRHTLRSIHLFASWVGRIHVVGAESPPAWLDTGHPAVAFGAVPDPKGRLLALDDDTFLGRPVRPTEWFAPGRDLRPVEVDVSRADVQGRLDDLLDRDQDWFRLVELHAPARARQVVEGLVADLLERYLPVPAPWERDLRG